MGRDPGRPADYHPLLQFELRQKAEGGDLLEPPELLGAPNEIGRRECLVLVHGFNDTDGEAARAYLGFRVREKDIFHRVEPDPYGHRFGDTFWPGDADWWWLIDKFDFLVYPAAVKKAVRGAPLLVELITRMPNLMRVDFIAHSLGCRLALETAKLLARHSGLHVGRICLMAAAVPSEFLEPSGRYYDLLTALHQGGTRIQVLHSTSDLVLHFAFPPGQALAGEPSSRALGRDGPTPSMPGCGSTLTQHTVQGAHHSDYWGYTGSAASKDATRAAGNFLKLGDVGREVAAPRRGPAAAEPLPERTVGRPRVVGSWERARR